VFALLAHLYASKYDIPLKKLKEQMAMVAIKNHRNAMFNPKAQFHKEITMEDVFGSAMVASPLQLYDCCPFTDGAAAVVLAPAETAKRLVKKPVYIVGVGQASAGPLYTQKDIPRVKARELAAKQAYNMAGLSPRDVDLAELHDCFTVAEILASEGLGLFEHGTGGYAVERGDTKIGGKVAINASGGLKAKGHPIGATGAAQVYEVVKQLRGEAGQRQVEGAKTGITDTLGGDLGTVCNILLRN
jgi:acetyl-CoA C-acetyltransferase